MRADLRFACASPRPRGEVQSPQTPVDISWRRVGRLVRRVIQRRLEGLRILRLGKSLALSWEPDVDFVVDSSSEYPCFGICAEAEKGFEDRRLSAVAN